MNFSFETSLPRMSPTVRKLESFADYPVGWHFGRGGPASAGAIGIARRALNWFVSYGLTSNDVFLSEDGEILITSYHGPYHVAALVSEVDGGYLRIERNGDEVSYVEWQDIRELRGLVLKAGSVVWNMFGSSTPETSTHGARSLMILPSSGRGAAVCHSSSSSVQRPVAA